MSPGGCTLLSRWTPRQHNHTASANPLPRINQRLAPPVTSYLDHLCNGAQTSDNFTLSIVSPFLKSLCSLLIKNMATPLQEPGLSVRVLAMLPPSCRHWILVIPGWLAGWLAGWVFHRGLQRPDQQTLSAADRGAACRMLWLEDRLAFKVLMGGNCWQQRWGYSDYFLEMLELQCAPWARPATPK